MADDPEPKFTWGDTVVVSTSAPDELRPGEFGSIVGITTTATPTTYTVEFGDGRDAEIPEPLLSGHIAGH